MGNLCGGLLKDAKSLLQLDLDVRSNCCIDEESSSESEEERPKHHKKHHNHNKNGET